MATKEELDFLSRITQWADDMAEAEKEAKDLDKIWTNLAFSTGIIDTDVTDFGMNFTAAQLASAVNNLSVVTDLFDNTAVAAVDRRAIWNKVRDFGTRR